ncbi:MAG: glycosyltransferase family 1 protein [Deltaproteobacteria bacterium]
MMVMFIGTLEDSGIDRYSQELSKRIGVPTVETHRYLSLKESLRLLRKVRQTGHLVHFPSQHFARYGLFLNKPFIVTVHDLVRLCIRLEREDIQERIGLKLDCLGLKRAKHIITVSECTKADLIRYLKITESKISVIYNGVDRSVFKPVLGRHFEFPYVLYVGTERPRKDFGTLLEAFVALKREANQCRNLKLVKVGNAGRSDQFRQATLVQISRLGLEGQVIFTNYVSDMVLARLYSSAVALVIPSLYEGFGLPVIEAMACGCPIIASNSSSLPEVAGDAALFFTPKDVLELAHCLRRLIVDPYLRNELIVKAFERVSRFTWEKAARETLDVYRRVGANRPWNVITATVQGKAIKREPDTSSVGITN